MSKSGETAQEWEQRVGSTSNDMRQVYAWCPWCKTRGYVLPDDHAGCRRCGRIWKRNAR